MSAVSVICAGLNVLMADAPALAISDQEQANVEFWLPMINWLLLFAIVFLLGFAVAIRYIAKRTTHPCHWCMEFISNREEVCPRCGKNAGHAPALSK